MGLLEDALARRAFGFDLNMLSQDPVAGPAVPGLLSTVNPVQPSVGTPFDFGPLDFGPRQAPQAGPLLPGLRPAGRPVQPSVGPTTDFGPLDFGPRTAPVAGPGLQPTVTPFPTDFGPLDFGPRTAPQAGPAGPGLRPTVNPVQPGVGTPTDFGPIPDFGPRPAPQAGPGLPLVASPFPTGFGPTPDFGPGLDPQVEPGLPPTLDLSFLGGAPFGGPLEATASGTGTALNSFGIRPDQFSNEANPALLNILSLLGQQPGNLISRQQLGGRGGFGQQGGALSRFF